MLAPHPAVKFSVSIIVCRHNGWKPGFRAHRIDDRPKTHLVGWCFADFYSLHGKLIRDKWGYILRSLLPGQCVLGVVNNGTWASASLHNPNRTLFCESGLCFHVFCSLHPLLAGGLQIRTRDLLTRYALPCFPGVALHPFECVAPFNWQNHGDPVFHVRYLDNAVVVFSFLGRQICKLDLYGSRMQSYANTSHGTGLRVGDEEKQEIFSLIRRSINGSIFPVTR